MQPRTHHYRYAHLVLPGILRHERVNLIGLATSGALDPALIDTWHGLGAELPAEDRLAPDGLSSRLARAGDVPVVLITMPPAQRITEAHFVAAAPADPAAKRRVLTLEYTVTLTGGPATVLGEWTDRGHANLGPGPEPSAEAFLAAVQRLIGA